MSERKEVVIDLGPPRIPGLSMQAAVKVLEELDGKVSRYVGELDLRYAQDYIDRAHMRYAVGWDAAGVLDDFWMASRCLASDFKLFLSRHPAEQLLTRRISPVEAGVLSGQIDLAKRLAAGYGLPVLTAQAGLGGESLKKEMNILSPGLLGQPISHPQHLLGLAAAVYAGALASAVRGYADEVLLTVKSLADVAFRGELSEGHKGVMARYSGLCEIILELTRPAGRNLPAMLSDQIERYTSRLKNNLGTVYLKPQMPVRYLDTSALSLMALASLTERDLKPFPPNPEMTPNAIPYMDFVVAMTEVDRSEILEKEREEMERMAAHLSGMAEAVNAPKEEETPSA